MKRILRLLLGLSIAAYLGAAIFMTVYQRNLLYHPAPDWQSPADHGLPNAARQQISASDGTLLVGWWIAPKRDDAPVFLYFHGNADGMSRRAVRFGLMTADGSGLLAMSYRGYGGSAGAPSEAALHADALRIYAHLRETMPANRIVLFGESLGTGVALNLARHVEGKAVILDSPYFSVLHRAEAMYPWLPISRLLTDTYRSDLWIRSVNEPVLILHGSADDLIPLSDSQRLAAIGSPARIARKVYQGQPHVVPYNQGPSVDVPAWLATLP
ncbi:COG1073 Hydrolases of the alpha/beta superfamily [Rhabdaerophilaceae bacterium]